ncbi:hypothetical protein RM549_06555 [Salegentibacter sp. F188]|uniref:Uncharacterized protein n=1 Tax=Autumnicola patrickiae TaxID=3075591 RepID=A0ABU3E0B8_9FLAO|nr:hypothetical protein [Salegentibacter sp. F188]MDT0689438.1 hypothetical protein [Salegentibacter sp. F188]
MKNLFFLLIFAATLNSCNQNNTANTSSSAENTDLPQQIANANGLQSFEDVEKLNFTFNVKVQDTIRSQRSWEWNPQTNEISLTEKGTTRSYTQDEDLTEEEKEIDQKFINDTYWLLFPYQLVWSDAEITEEENATAPISGETMNKLIVSYAVNGGYTPGDTYDIYYNDDLIVQEWVYKSADGNREMPTSWEDYQEYNGVKIAKSHKSPDGSFELFFSDIVVE